MKPNLLPDRTASLSEMDCHATVMQLMLAGLDAVHGSLNWLFLFLSIHNDVQEKLFKEISTQIGENSNKFSLYSVCVELS